MKAEMCPEGTCALNSHFYDNVTQSNNKYNYGYLIANTTKDAMMCDDEIKIHVSQNLRIS